MNAQELSWKRGTFRAYAVLAVLFVAWAGWESLVGINMEARQKWYATCSAAEDLRREWHSERPGELAQCFERAQAGTPLGVDVVIQYPKWTAILGAVILAIPVAVWWLLRGIVALVLWIVRGFHP